MKILLLGTMILIGPSACNTPKSTAADTVKTCPCPKDIMCTEDFRFITVTVVDKAGNPVELQRYETVRASSNAVLKRSDITEMQPGTYVVASDGEKESISTCGEKFLFRGYRGGKKVIEESFTLRNDCCHVERQSGQTQIVL
jgi:hypothetical protein